MKKITLNIVFVGFLFAFAVQCLANPNDIPESVNEGANSTGAPANGVTNGRQPAAGDKSSNAAVVTDSPASQSTGNTADRHLPATHKQRHCSLPKHVLGVAAGIVVGVPVDMVRKPLDEDKYGIKSVNGDNKKGRIVVPTAVFWAPFAAVGGVLEAPFYAVNNSLVNMDKPFSKEQFSVKERVPENNVDPIKGTSEK